MEARCVGLRELARHADVSPSHLSKLTRGTENKQASVDLLSRLAGALELPPEYFVEYREAVRRRVPAL